MTRLAPASLAAAFSGARLYLAEARAEVLKILRQPAFVVPTLAFPMVFYGMFGLAFGGRQAIGNVKVATYLLATYATFGVMGAALFGFGAGVAMERGYGWLQLKRASPMPPQAYLAAKVAVSSLLSALVVLALFLLGASFGGVRLSLPALLGLMGILVAGSLPFCALGLVIGCTTAPNVAPVVVNLLFLPMSFCSGLWLPLAMLPRFLQRAAPFLPSYHLGQLALRQVGAVHGGALVHVAALAGFTGVFLLLAMRAFSRDDGRVNL